MIFQLLKTESTNSETTLSNKEICFLFQLRNIGENRIHRFVLWSDELVKTGHEIHQNLHYVVVAALDCQSEGLACSSVDWLTALEHKIQPFKLSKLNFSLKIIITFIATSTSLSWKLCQKKRGWSYFFKFDLHRIWFRSIKDLWDICLSGWNSDKNSSKITFWRTRVQQNQTST